MSRVVNQNDRGRLYRFFWWAAGADRDLMLQCPKSEHEKMLSIGITVCLTAILAGISGYFAISTIVDVSSYAIMISAFWGFVIFNLDRFIVMSIRKDRQGRTWKEVVSALPRIVLAILIAFVVSKPIEMELFATQIEFAQKELIQQKDTTDIEERFREFGVGEKRSELDEATVQRAFLDSLSKLPEPSLQAYTDKKAELAAARTERDRLNAEHSQKKRDRLAKFQQVPFIQVPIYRNDSIVGYSSVRDDKTDEWYAWYQLWLETRETPGREGTLTLQRNAQWQIVSSLVNQLNRIRTHYYNDINRRLTLAETNRANIEWEKDSVETVFQEKLNSDISINQQYYQSIFAKLEAFRSLVKTEREKGNTTPYWSQWIILLLFFVLETAPIISKILSKRGPYDELLDSLSWRSTLIVNSSLGKLKDSDLDRLETINAIKPDKASALLLADSKIRIGEPLAAIPTLQKLSEDFPHDNDIRTRLLEAFEATGDKRKSQQQSNYIQIDQEERLFESNLSRTFYLDYFEVRNVESFFEIEWYPQGGMNIMLGKNGYGKSYLLRLMVAIVQNNASVVKEYSTKTFGEAKVDLLEGESTVVTIKMEGDFLNSNIGKVPVLAISDQRFIDKSKSAIAISDSEEAEHPNHSAYSFLNQKPFDLSIQEFLYGLCIDYDTGTRSFDEPVFQLLESVIVDLTNEPFRFHAIIKRSLSRYTIEVVTEGNQEILPIQKASQGTLSIITIFGLIFYYLKSFPERKEFAEVSKRPGIVIIDEIDAHLHPSWQQKVIGILRRTFPNVQFFITAHNPAIVAGCHFGEISVLRKDESGFMLEQIEEDFVGTSTSSIYKRVFEIEDRDIEYNRRYNDALREGTELPEFQDLSEDARLDGLRKQYEDQLLTKESEIMSLENRIKELESTTKK
ncbi:MAG: hypothetical protein Roseis2KO_41790 [Roseivirga sp.]